MLLQLQPLRYSLLTNEVYPPVSNSVNAVKYVVELRMDTRH
jgi:hypothetical protein